MVLKILPAALQACPTETANHDKSNNYQYYDDYTNNGNYSVHLQTGKKIFLNIL